MTPTDGAEGLLAFERESDGSGGCQGLSARYLFSSSGSIGLDRLEDESFELARWGRSRSNLDDCNAAVAALRAALDLALRAWVAEVETAVEALDEGAERERDEPEVPTAADVMAALVCVFR